MKSKLFMGLMIILSSFSAGAYEVQRLRDMFYKASQDPAEAERFYSEMQSVSADGHAVVAGYKAMAEFMKCYHSYNPVTKITYFNSGKYHLDNAIRSDSMNLELRYLRFSVQTSVPSFLGYKGNIKKDKKMLIENLHRIPDDELSSMITSFLLTSKYCNEEEKEKVRQYLGDNHFQGRQ